MNNKARIITLVTSLLVFLVACSNNNQKPNHRLIEEAKRKLVQDQHKIQERISESCEGYWKNMSPVETHEYLTKKRVKSFGLKLFLDKTILRLENSMS